MKTVMTWAAVVGVIIAVVVLAWLLYETARELSKSEACDLMQDCR